MQFFDTLLTCYGWEGIALAGAVLAMFGVQLYYYIFVYGRIPGYKNNRRSAVLDAEPPVSVVVPLFSEDYSFVEERLPLMLAQSYPDFEVVIVYVGHDSDFYEDLVRLKQSFPQIVTTKIHLDPRFPISRKMALNVGIKSAHHEHMVFTSTDACPQTDRWLSLMAKGFTRGEIVVGYCGVERKKGFSNYMMRAWRMMHSADCLAPRLAARKNVGRHGLVDEPAALLRLGVPLLSADGPQLYPVGAGIALALLPDGRLCGCGDAVRVQDRGAGPAGDPLSDRGDRGAAHRAPSGRIGHDGPLFRLRPAESALGLGAERDADAQRRPRMEIADYIVAEDRRLVELVLEGDDTAFEYLFNRYRDAIHRLFVQRLGGVNDADDLLQETFIKVYINLHRYSTDYTFGQWVYTIARNTFIDFVRRRQDDLSIDERFSSPPSTAPTPEESVISLQQRTQIEHYLERLTPRYRTLIVMRFFDEYSYEEIAAKLTLPLGTVKTQIHRAREQMCKLIAQGDER